MKKIDLVNFNKLNLNKNKNFSVVKNNNITPVIKNMQSNSLNMLANYNKAGLYLSFSGNEAQLTREQKEEYIKKMTFRDDEGKNYSLFKPPYTDIRYLVDDEKKYQRTLELANLTFINSKGIKENIFQDGSSIAQIVRDDKAYERAKTLLNAKYIDCDGIERRVFISGNNIRSLSLNEIKFDRTKSLINFKFKNSKGQWERIFKHGYSIATIVSNDKPDITCYFEDRAKQLANITYTNILGQEERVFSERNIAQIAMKQSPEIDENFKKWAIWLASITYKDANSIDKRAISSEDIKRIATDPNIEQNSFGDVVQLKKIALRNPDLYINGEIQNDTLKCDEVNSFFSKNPYSLALSCSILGKKLTQELLKMRFDDAQEYLDTLAKFSPKTYNSIFDVCEIGTPPLDLLKGLLSAKDQTGKDFSSKQKIEFIDLISAYKNNNSDTFIIENMTKNKRVDINKLNLRLLIDVFKNIGFDEDEIVKIPNDKLNAWNMKYVHLLSKEIDKDKDPGIFREFFKASNFHDFKKYISDPLNRIGQINTSTQLIFKDEGINYDKWFNPSGLNNMQFKAKDRNTQNLLQMAKQTEEDVEELRKGPAKSFIDKCLAPYIKGGEFKVPSDCETSKAKLVELNKNILIQLDNVFGRAESNKNDIQRREISETTLTIKNHILQRIDNIKKMPDSKTAHDIDLTIKMWDRIPQKDIFQGNYSTCCIGMGEINGFVMPHYLMNSAFNMIELVDNQSQNTIGNALCYFVKTEDDKPALIIDNIEIKNSKKVADEVGIELRDTIAEFAKKVAVDVTGDDDVKIYMGKQYDDIPTSDLKVSEKQIRFLGNVDCNYIYLDAYGSGWRSSKDLEDKVKLYELK